MATTTPPLLEVDRETVLRMHGRDNAIVANDLKMLRDWLATQPHLPEIDDVRLEAILLNCKYSLEKTKRTVDTYFTLRSVLPAFFENRDPALPSIHNISKVFTVTPMRVQTPKKERVLVMKLLDTDVDNFEAVMFYKYMFMVEELRLLSDYSYAVHMVFDMDGGKMGHLTKLTPSVISKAYRICVQGFKLKLHGIHYVNAPSFLDLFLTLIKGIIKPKLFDRIFIHPDFESMHKILPKEVLPEDYGGLLGKIEDINAEWYEELVRHRDWFIAQSKIRVDERKRPEKLDEDIFGSIHGSFRVLDID